MTKDFQQELTEVVKEGIKPSTIKKLKKSKSADDLPAVPVSPTTRIKKLGKVDNKTWNQVWKALWVVFTGKKLS